MRAALLAGLLVAGGAPTALADLTEVGGQLVLPTERRVPPGAVLRVRLMDLALGESQAVVLAEQRLQPQGARAAFRLIYDSALIGDAGRYVLRATLEHDGARLYLATADLPLGAGAQADQLQLFLENPAARGGPDTLYGNAYRAIEARDQPIPGHIGVTLEFTREGTVRGSTGCNRLNGAYEVTAETLRFGQIATTRMACTPDRDRIEDRMMRILSETRGWRVEGPVLTLIDDAGRVMAVLRDDL